MFTASSRVLRFTLLLGAVGCAEGNTIPDDDGSTSTSAGANAANGGANGSGGTNGSGGSGGAGGSGCGDMCDGDDDGVLDGADDCADTPAGEPVNSVGCSDSQLEPTLQEMWPPYGLTWTPTGDPGRAGGLTWTYTGIDHADLFHILWIPCDDPATPCGVSLDGPIDMTEAWQLSAAESNLAGGIVVFTNATHIALADSTNPALTGRLTLTIVGETGEPLPFADVSSLGVTARDGQYGAEIPGASFTVVALIEVQDSTLAWTPYLDYFDAAPTPDPGPGSAVSFGGSFYDE
ncbi:MAG: hypothetical protein HOW73_15535 [Polyangiaceae bacterium]|nr:hypothetical protein [Polyangiaceae bacterium]